MKQNKKTKKNPKHPEMPANVMKIFYKWDIETYKVVMCIDEAKSLGKLREKYKDISITDLITIQRIQWNISSGNYRKAYNEMITLGDNIDVAAELIPEKIWEWLMELIYYSL